MKITHCDFCGKKLKDEDVIYQTCGKYRFELCEECHKEFKKLESEYQDRFNELNEQLESLNQNFKEKINKLKGDKYENNTL